MIHIDRNRVQAPAILSKRRVKAFQKLKEFYKPQKFKRSQLLPPFQSEVYSSREVRAALRKLFHGKCAFCETPIEGKTLADIEHFRPKWRAHGLKGKVDPDYYWWLAYEWANLYLICRKCNKNKGNRFPVRGSRAPIGTTGERLAKERRLILDPCVDNPELELVFNANGTVEGTTERAKITIVTFGLNRTSLVQARREMIDSVDRTAWVLMTKDEPRKWKEENFVDLVISELVDPISYLAAVRQHLKRFHQDAVQAAKATGVKNFVFQPEYYDKGYTAAIWIQQIEIENFRCLKHIDVSFPSQKEKYEPWLMLLGDNGTGKSSLLKAITLALIADNRLRQQLEPRADLCMRRNSRAQNGLIRVHFSIGDPVELRFSKSRRSFERIGDTPNLSLLAYGSSRWLPIKRSRQRSPVPRRVCVDHLFYPGEPMLNVERWLANTTRVSSDQFKLLAISLKDLLTLTDNNRIQRREGKLATTIDGSTVSIQELSDGYQSMMALATNIMFNLSDASFDMEGVEGTVLLDEIEVHLHPVWKIKIIESLRKMFPRIRFIATTHDPLCLHGLNKNEVHRLIRHTKTGNIQLEKIDVPKGIRADQLLIGEWFGLSTTRDRETKEMIEEHGKLLLVSRKTKQQRIRQAELKRTLRQRLGEFGETPMEHLALKTTAEFMQKTSQELSPKQRRNLKEKILARLKDKKMSR